MANFFQFSQTDNLNNKQPLKNKQKLAQLELKFKMLSTGTGGAAKADKLAKQIMRLKEKIKTND